MKPANPCILTINGGSSSIKFALYHVDDPLKHARRVTEQGGVLNVPPEAEFPGMLNTRSFEIVVVSKSHGTGVDVTANPDKVVSYDGRRLTVQLPPG